jgi:hypothetical protein
MGFAGVQNFPTVGADRRRLPQNLEETGMGYALEVEMIRLAASSTCSRRRTCSARTTPPRWPRPGADLVVCHMGLTTGGSIGAETALTLDDCVDRVDRWGAAARAARPDVLVLCHGGPIAEPSDAAYVLQHATGVHGFYGASAWSGCRPSRPSRRRPRPSRPSRSEPAPARVLDDHRRTGVRMPTVALAGTLDTKGHEYAFLRDRLLEQGVDVLLVDVGVFAPLVEPDVSREEVARPPARTPGRWPAPVTAARPPRRWAGVPRRC